MPISLADDFDLTRFGYKCKKQHCSHMEGFNTTSAAERHRTSNTHLFGPPRQSKIIPITDSEVDEFIAMPNGQYQCKSCADHTPTRLNKLRIHLQSTKHQEGSSLIEQAVEDEEVEWFSTTAIRCLSCDTTFLPHSWSTHIKTKIHLSTTDPMYAASGKGMRKQSVPRTYVVPEDMTMVTRSMHDNAGRDASNNTRKTFYRPA
ncbi:hypothetical protein HDU79_000149, partial [Rhizoclosmatium sp. JEL0117]